MKKIRYFVGFTLCCFVFLFAKVDAEATTLFRMYKHSEKDHLYSEINEKNHLLRSGWVYEWEQWNTPNSTSGTVPVYRLYYESARLKRHLFTTNITEVNTLQLRGWRNEGIAFRAYSSSGFGTRRAIYRLYNEEGQKHYLTGGVTERDGLVRAGWTYECVAFYIDRIYYF